VELFGAVANGRCVACNGALDSTPAIRVESFLMFACRDCGTWTVLPRPTAQMQSALHDREEYDLRPYLAHRRSALAALDRRCAAIFARIGEFTDLARLKGERVLDIGCDTGLFIACAASQFGISPVGADVARRAVVEAKARGVEAYLCTLEDAPSELRGFAVMTAIDVIEHVAEPQGFFTAMRERLRPGGVAYVETPNVDSLVYRVGRMLCGPTGAHPAAFFRRLFPQEHIQYYSAEGIDRVAKVCGLCVAGQGSRKLPAGEIAAGAITRLGVSLLQSGDSLSGKRLLRWAVLQRI
jgi:2-polyprenyl-3-methyl-5-hydroxy-6-metoxy-1,4-benzoquinol methylase